MNSKPAAIVSGVLVWCMLSTSALAAVDIDDAEKSVYANGHGIIIREDAKVSGKTIVTSQEEGAIRESDVDKDITNYTVFGGSKQKDVTGDTCVTIESGTVKNVFGGCGAGTVRDSANITGNTCVSITGGTINGSVYGGSEGRPANGAEITGNTEVTISGGSINGSVYGGSKNGNVDGDTGVVVEEASIGGMVFGGCKNGDVQGNASVTLADSTAKEVFGGSERGDVNNTDVTIESSVTGNVYGGSKQGNATGDESTSVLIANGSQTGKVYGGGRAGSTKKTSVTISGDDTVVNTIFAGSEKAGLTMNSEITLSGGHVSSLKVFGWGGNDLLAPVGPVNVNIFTYNGGENTYYLSRQASISVDESMEAYKMLGEDGYYLYAPFTFALRKTRSIPVRTVYQDTAGNELFTHEESVILTEGYSTSVSYQSWEGSYAKAGKYRLTNAPEAVDITYESDIAEYSFTVVAEALFSDSEQTDIPLGIPHTGDGPFEGCVIAAMALMSFAALPGLQKRY